MKAFKKCELCDATVSGEKCIFAIYKRVIDGKEHYFCCKGHAIEYEKKHRKQESRGLVRRKKGGKY